MTRTANTIAYLKRCQKARSVGYPVSYTTDAAWLVNMAINRRAGWPDDTSLSRGSAMPINGRYPKKAEGCTSYNALRLFACRINTLRLIVREQECPKRYRVHLATRLTKPEDL